MSNYKIGDKVLIEAEVNDTNATNEKYMSLEIIGMEYFSIFPKDSIYSRTPIDIDGNVLRPGDACEFWGNNTNSKCRAPFLTFDCNNIRYVNAHREAWDNCRKITKQETIEINGKTYLKKDVEEQLTKLKSI